MKKPILSIITVCKNEPFIEETCKSICEQTNQDFEWLIIDGKSTDNTLEKIKPYQNRADVFISEPDKGIYSGMNKGIRLATGTYMLFMNGGDLLFDKNTLAQVIPLLKQKQADVYYGDSYLLFENKNDCFVKTYPDKLTKKFFLNNTLGHQSAFIHRKLFEMYGLYREDFKIVSDKEKWLRFFDNQVRFTHIPFPCSQFRTNGVSSQTSPLLRSEDTKLLEEYFPKKVLKNSHIPYLKSLFNQNTR